MREERTNENDKKEKKPNDFVHLVSVHVTCFFLFLFHNYLSACTFCVLHGSLPPLVFRQRPSVVLRRAAATWARPLMLLLVLLQLPRRRPLPAVAGRWCCCSHARRRVVVMPPPCWKWRNAPLEKKAGSEGQQQSSRTGSCGGRRKEERGRRGRDAKSRAAVVVGKGWDAAAALAAVASCV